MTSLAYFEWSAEPDSDLDDEDALRQANPAYGIRINAEFSRLERDAMTDDEFARERLGIFPDEDEAPQWLVTPQAVWVARGEDAKADKWLTGKVSLAIEITQDTQHASVCVAGERSAGGVGVSCAIHGDGTKWLAPEVLALWADGSITHVVIDKAGPAAYLIPELEDEGVKVKEAVYADVKVATAQWGDAIESERLRYRNADTDLTDAVAVASWRPAGDTRIVDRRTGTDVTALTGCQLALWGHTQGEPPAKTYRAGGF